MDTRLLNFAAGAMLSLTTEATPVDAKPALQQAPDDYATPVTLVSLGVSGGVALAFGLTKLLNERKKYRDRIDSLTQELFQHLYQECIKEHPELAQVEVQFVGDEKQMVSPGYFAYPTKSNPKIQIVVKKISHDNYNKLYKEREKSVQKIAAMIGVPFDVLAATPELLMLFIAFHELGHAHEFINKYLPNTSMKDATAEWKKRTVKECDTLPVAGANAGFVRKMYENGELVKYYKKNRAFYKSRGINSPKELLEEHDIAYRNLPKEQYADNFAASFLRTHLRQI